MNRLNLTVIEGKAGIIKITLKHMHLCQHYKIFTINSLFFG